MHLSHNSIKDVVCYVTYAYVNPTAFVQLKTNAKITIGTKLKRGHSSMSTRTGGHIRDAKFDE